MSTIIINGSPRGKAGNTEHFICHFLKGTGKSYEVRYVVNEDVCTLAAHIAQYDTILLFFPLYIHAMPGIVMKLFEKMAPAKSGQRIGFVVQAGFIEAAETRIIKQVLDVLSTRLKYENLGVVTKGDAAAIGAMPKFMNRKLFTRLQMLGTHYERYGEFKKELVELLAQPYEISPFKAKLYELANRSGINHIFWRRFWKQNGVLKQGLAQPFATTK